MNRGDIYTAVLPGAYGKPRPVVILQDTDFNKVYSSVVIMPITTHPSNIARLRIEPSSQNGLQEQSYLMTNHITTIVKDKMGSFIGELEEEHLFNLNNRLLTLLGLQLLPQ